MKRAQAIQLQCESSSILIRCTAFFYRVGWGETCRNILTSQTLKKETKIFSIITILIEECGRGGGCTFSLGFKIFRPNIGEFAKFHYINLSPKNHHMKKFRFSEKVVVAGANTPFLLLALVLLDTCLLILFQK